MTLKVSIEGQSDDFSIFCKLHKKWNVLEAILKICLSKGEELQEPINTWTNQKWEGVIVEWWSAKSINYPSLISCFFYQGKNVYFDRVCKDRPYTL